LDELSRTFTADTTGVYWRTTLIATLLVTALLVIPAAALILMGDRLDPLVEAKNFSRKTARASSDTTHLRIRLEELGKATDLDYEQFRIKQYGYCAGSGAIVFALVMALSANFILATATTVLAGASVYLLLDRQLTQDVKKRRELIEAEFPAIVELLTLAIAAGETPLSAMLRIAKSADGALAKEFQIVVAGVRSGEPLHESLDAMGRRVKSVMIRRFVDALVTATLRGAPLVEVLSRHAVEARGNQRNRIMGAASKAEISMMIPVVFLILPISILFALWPSLTNLNMFAA
jgi:tight adherence protein C